jgi:hypothetical protein
MPLEPHDIATELAMPTSLSLGGLLERQVQSWLDHHHGSYAQELEAAAIKAVRSDAAATAAVAAGGRNPAASSR